MSKIFQITPPDGVPQAYYFYGTLAFLAGFNERWTHVILTQAERTIGATLSDEDSAAQSKQAEEGPATSS